MKILMVTSEAVPFSKSGGLADVIGALTPALVEKEHDARIIVPAYNVSLKLAGELVCSLSIPLLSRPERIEIRLREHEGIKYYFVCHPMFNDRLGIYGDTSFAPYSDNSLRFLIFAKASIAFCEKTGWIPDILHCHDWTAGLVPYLLKIQNNEIFRNTKTVFTIHNLAYQGIYPRMDFLFSLAKADEQLFQDGQLNMLRSGLVFSDFITTVSPTYAKEIQTPEQGCGLENILVKRKSKLRGIVNGIDLNEWNPKKDQLIDHHFSVENLSGKAKLKEEIQSQLKLPLAPDIPLFAMISRLASQKGFDELLICLEQILKENKLQFVIVGTGDSSIERKLTEIASQNDNLSVKIMFSNSLAHLVEAGSDFFLMPSRYEPCGLNQLYSLRYGTIPIARRTGGLADTIIDIDEYPEEGTGILFEQLTAEEITKHVKRAVELYHRPSFEKMKVRAMEQDFSWNTSANEYISVFKELLKEN